MNFEVKRLSAVTIIALFVIPIFAFLFQNCSSRVAFETKLDSSENLKNVACDPVAMALIACETATGYGGLACDNSCAINRCKDPLATITGNVCVSPLSFVNLFINAKKSELLIPGTTYPLLVQTSNNITTLDDSLSKLTHVSGVCAKSLASIADLDLTGNKIVLGSQNIVYNQTIADKIGGCTWSLTAGANANKQDTVQFTALLCVPDQNQNTACTTNDNRPGMKYCQANGFGYECRPNATPPTTIPPTTTTTTMPPTPTTIPTTTTTLPPPTTTTTTTMPPPPAACIFNGQSVTSGSTVRAYTTTNVPFGNTCAFEDRLCTNGTLSGSAAYSTCSVLPGANCSFNGSTVNHTQSITAYLANQVAYGQTCTSQNRTCTNGVLSGSYSNATCQVASAANCTLNGQTVNSGSTVRVYSQTSVPFGGTCPSQERTCTNGALSGTSTYIHFACTVQAPVSCTFNGSTVNHGASVTAYYSSTVPNGSSCESQTRTCSNGFLSGNFSAPGCVVQPPYVPSACYFNGRTIADGSSVTAFAAGSVPFGSSCQSQSRSCSDGSLSGSYGYDNCTVTAPASCSFNGQTIPHGGSVTGYVANSVNYGSTCTSEARSCVNGTLTGSAAFASCTVQPKPLTCNLRTELEQYTGCNFPNTGYVNGTSYSGMNAWSNAAQTACQAIGASGGSGGGIGSYCSPSNIPSAPHSIDAYCDCY